MYGLKPGLSLRLRGDSVAAVFSVVLLGLGPHTGAIAAAGVTGLCGNGTLETGETCDDGNAAAGDGCSAACEVEPGFACSAPVPATTGNNIVSDPGFESGTPNPYWEESSVEFSTPVCNANCGDLPTFAGDWYVLFGGTSRPEQAAVSQSITVPAGATTLAFDLLVHACDSTADRMRVTLDDLEVFSSGSCTQAADYQRFEVDIQGYADGQPHTLRFEADLPASNRTAAALMLGEIQISDNTGGTPAQPSQCAPAPETCAAFGFGAQDSGDLAGWTRFNTGALNLDWVTTDDNMCGSGTWTPGNHTGGAGEAACMDSDAAGDGQIDAWLCSPPLDYSQATDPALEFRYKYHVYGTPDGGDAFEVWIGQSPPDPVSVAGYELLFESTGSGGPLARTPGRSERLALTSAASYVCYRYAGDNDWYAQIDDVAVTATQCAVADSDGDGLADNQDNCILVANADQLDTDGDGFGNLCDADLNNNCTINFTDLGVMKSVFFTDDPHADLNGSGAVNFTDLAMMKAMMFQAPGPSGVPNICDGH